MAVVVTIEVANSITQQYDEILGKMDLGGKTAPQGIFHVCAEDGQGGLFMCDTWESAEAFQAFADNTMGPLLAAAGITERPKITVRPVHNFLER